MGLRRSCGGGAGRVGLQTVAQEFVALVHGLLGAGRSIVVRGAGRTVIPDQYRPRISPCAPFSIAQTRWTPAWYPCDSWVVATASRRPIPAALLPRIIAIWGADPRVQCDSGHLGAGARAASQQTPVGG